MVFEWDAGKNRSNRAKHGIDFDTAARIFADPFLLIRQDRLDKETGEQRWHALGAVAGAGPSPILLVVHVYREADNGEEIIRIISARKARPSERQGYPG